MTVQAPQLIVNESVVFAELDDEAVLLNVESGVYFGLDEIGTEIWNLLTAGFDELEIIHRLGAEYEVDEAELRGDVEEFIGTLEANGLVRRAGSDSAA